MINNYFINKDQTPDENGFMYRKNLYGEWVAGNIGNNTRNIAVIGTSIYDAKTKLINALDKLDREDKYLEKIFGRYKT